MSQERETDPTPAPSAPPLEPSAPVLQPTPAGVARGLGIFEIAALLVTVVVCRFLVTKSCAVYDDAFITWRYARHMAEGLGLVFNPGESWEPVLGTTTPLFGVLLAGCSRLGLGIPESSLGISILADGVTAVLLALLLRRDRVAAVVTLVGFAAFPPLARIAVGGMEVSLFCMLGVLASYLHGRGKLLGAGTAAALCTCVRPEGVLLILVLGLENLRQPRRLARMLVPSLAIGLVYAGVLTAFYHTPIPQSITAKIQQHPANWSRWKRILQHAFLPHPACWPLLPVTLIGLFRALRVGGALRTLSLFALAMTLAYLAKRPNTWGWYYFVPLTAWVLWFGIGLQLLRDWGPESVRRATHRFQRTAGTTFVALIVVSAVVVVTRMWPSQVPERVYRPLQRWAAETSQRYPDAKILASDIGAISHAWNGTVLDSVGLTWPAAVELYGGSQNQAIADVRPEYLLLSVERRYLAPFLEDSALLALYDPLRRFSVADEQDLHPSLDAMPEQWVQDYLLYRRKDFAE